MMNEASQWRFVLAQQIARSYAANPKARVVMIAGSMGRGRADRYSDLEIEVYWSAPPSQMERQVAAEGSGGTLVSLSDYEDDEWEEVISMGGFQVSTSTFLIETMESYLVQVLEEYSTALLPQMRLSSLLHAVPLVGTDLVAHWRGRAVCYPDDLVSAMLRENLAFRGFGYAEEMLAARDDLLALFTIFCRIERQILGALLGLNRLYLPHPDFKSMDELIEEMKIAPLYLSARLKQAFRLPALEGVQLLHGVIEEVFALVEASFPVFDTTLYRERVHQRRGIQDDAPQM